MTRSLIFLPIVLAFSSLAIAQMSPEEAYRRLHERQMARLGNTSAPSTAPTTQQVGPTSPVTAPTTRPAAQVLWFAPVGGLPEGRQWELARDVWMQNERGLTLWLQNEPKFLDECHFHGPRTTQLPITDTYVANLRNGRVAIIGIGRMPRVLDSEQAHTPARAKAQPGEFNGVQVTWRVWKDPNNGFEAWTRCSMPAALANSQLQILVSFTLAADDEASLNELIKTLSTGKLILTHPPRGEPLEQPGDFPWPKSIPWPDPMPDADLGHRVG
jgi:hypothetical protein